MDKISPRNLKSIASDGLGQVPKLLPLMFGGWLIFRSKARETAWFLISAGLILALLTLDDLYLLHEELLPDHFFIPQKLVFAA